MKEMEATTDRSRGDSTSWLVLAAAVEIGWLAFLAWMAWQS